MEGYPAVAELRVRYSEEDNLGHVNNARYFTYMEEGRVEYLRRMGIQERLPDWKDFVFVIAEAQIRYLAPSYYGDILRIGCRCSYIRSSSFGFEYEIRRASDDRRIAAGWTRQVAVEPGTGKPVPLPERVRRLIETVEDRPVPEQDPRIKAALQRRMPQ